VGFDSCSGQYFLETIEPFELKGKLYGDTNQNAERIQRPFHDREESSTGVLLTGEKGSGKTMLAKRISILGAAQDIPTIVVNQAWCGETFNGFMQMVQQPAIVIFDEFEKVYAENGKQEALLTLLDGVYSSKKLFLLTCNNKWMLNRIPTCETVQGEFSTCWTTTASTRILSASTVRII
jgi:SpoVK/Ycf46/Vps4 family AAA+-type ATPase